MNLSDFPPDVQAAAEAAWDALDNSPTETWEPIARAIMADRAARLDLAGLRPRQAQCLRFIADYQRDHEGVSPSLGEIAVGLRIASRSQAHRLVEELESLGRIKRLPNRSRAITIIANPAN